MGLKLKKVEKLLNNRIALNLLFWLFYAIIPFSVNLGQFGSKPNMYTDIQFYLECMLLGYVNNLVLLPKYFERRKYWLYFSLLFAMVFLYNYTLSSYISHLLSPNLTINAITILYSFVDFIVFVIAFSAGRIIQQHLQQNKKISQLEEERLQSEVDFLRTQINPHLLFNTLNTLYSYSLEASAKAPSMILKLSEIMRYMLYETNEKSVSLDKEITYIENYVQLQELRIEGRGKVSFQIAGDTGGLHIAPMLLISFVENAFKYSMDSQTDQIDITIAIEIQGEKLNFSVINSYEEQQYETEQKAGGLGISNTQKRLQLLYPSNHQLSIKKEMNYFSVNLNLSLAI